MWEMHPLAYQKSTLCICVCYSFFLKKREVTRVTGNTGVKLYVALFINHNMLDKKLQISQGVCLFVKWP